MKDEKRERLMLLSDLKELRVSKDDPDIRGWDVVTADKKRMGKVHELVIDTIDMKVRYLDIDMDGKILDIKGSSHVLIPIAGAQLDDEDNRVYLTDITVEELRALPPYDHRRITREFETNIGSWFDRARGTGSAGAATAAATAYDDRPADPRHLDTRPVDSRPIDPGRDDVRPLDSRPIDPRHDDVQPLDSRPVDPRRDDVRPLDSRPVDPRRDDVRPLDSRPIDPRRDDVGPADPHPDARRADPLAADARSLDRRPGEPLPPADTTADPFYEKEHFSDRNFWGRRRKGREDKSYVIPDEPRK